MPQQGEGLPTPEDLRRIMSESAQRVQEETSRLLLAKQLLDVEQVAFERALQVFDRRGGKYTDDGILWLQARIADHLRRRCGLPTPVGEPRLAAPTAAGEVPS